jgi:hypothetical protein
MKKIITPDKCSERIRIRVDLALLDADPFGRVFPVQDPGARKWNRINK